MTRTLSLLMSLLLVGCTGQSESVGEATAVPSHRGGTLHLAIAGDPGTLNPLRMSTTHAAQVFAILQPGLVRLDPSTGEWQAGLAQSWDASDDGLTYEFRLDPNYRWSDGAAFTSADVVFSYEVYADTTTGYARRSRLVPIASVEAVDESTVTVRLHEPIADPLSHLTFDILPRHLLVAADRVHPEQWTIGDMPVTLGSFQLAQWRHNDRLVLERNAHFGGPPANVDRVEILVQPDAATRWVQLTTGEIDLATGINVDQAKSLASRDDLRVENLDGRSVAFLQYNLRHRFLADARLRRALSVAIDRESITKGVMAGFARPAATVLPPVSWAHDASLTADAYDPDEAAALLSEAGYTRVADGWTLGDEKLQLEMLFVAGDPIREAIAGFLVQSWREVGIEVSARPVEIASLVRIARSDDFQMMFAQFGGPLDADLRPFLHTGGRFNFGHVSIASIDEALDEATSAVDRAQAIEAAHRLQVDIQSAQPVTPLYFPQTLLAIRTRVRNAQPNWLTPFAHLEDWWLDAKTSPEAGESSP